MQAYRQPSAGAPLVSMIAKHIVVLDAETGALRWKQPVERRITRIVVTADLVFVAADEDQHSTLFLFDRATGAPKGSVPPRDAKRWSRRLRCLTMAARKKNTPTPAPVKKPRKTTTRAATQGKVLAKLPVAMTGRASPAKAADGDKPVFAYIACRSRSDPSRNASMLWRPRRCRRCSAP